MKPIKIMHVLHSFDIGGLENGVVNVLNTMDRTRFLHTICCIGRSGRNAEKLSSLDVEIFEMQKGEGRELLLALRLGRLFRSVPTDIVHTRNWGAVDGILGAKLAGVPIIVHGEHGRDMTDPNGSNRKRNLIRRILSCFVDRYFTVSQDLREWLINVAGINERKVQAICNGVDTLTFNSDNKDLVRAKHGYGPKDLIIGTVGRLDPVKDQQLLIRAFARLEKKYNNLHLLIIGNGPSWEDLTRLADELGLHEKVFFYGMRHDVPEVLKLLNIFVLPSIFEGISNTILEAMAVGIPMVVSRVGGNPELVVDGETGYLVPKQDIDALTVALERYIVNQDLMRSHGSAGRRRALDMFSLERMTAQYEATYTQLVTQQ